MITGLSKLLGLHETGPVEHAQHITNDTESVWSASRLVSDIASAMFSTTRGWIATGFVGVGGWLMVKGPNMEGDRLSAVIITTTGLGMASIGAAIGTCEYANQQRQH